MSAVRRGSGSHNPEKISAESFLVSDFMERRIPVPVMSFLAVADVHNQPKSGENLSRTLLEQLDKHLQPVALTEEELKRETILGVIVSTFRELNSFLHEKANQTNDAATLHTSLTFALTTRNAAFIGHIGKNRIFLLHDDRLFDLTPAKPVALEKKTEEAPSLFDNINETDLKKNNIEPPDSESPGNFLGQEKFSPSYNEVALSPGDVLIMCSDGISESVKEKEIAEVFISSINVARACNVLAKLAAQRNPRSSATVVAWKYHIENIGQIREKRSSRKRHKLRSRLYSISIILALFLVLFFVFAFGFAIGLRITDAFRRQSKEIANKPIKPEEHHEVIKTKPPEMTQGSTNPPGTQNPSKTQKGTTLTIIDSGVRVRSAPGLEGVVLGFLAKGELVTVIGSATSPDGKTWYKIRGYVNAGRQKKLTEGYVRSDFTKSVPQQ